MGGLKLSAIFLLTGCLVCACAGECTMTCFLVYGECAKNGAPGSLDDCREDLLRCADDCAKMGTGSDPSGPTVTDDGDSLAKRGSWSKRRGLPELDSIQGGQKHRLEWYLDPKDDQQSKLINDGSSQVEPLPIPLPLMFWGGQPSGHGGDVRGKPISFERRGSWSKRQPIGVDERGSWSKQEPINVDERGSWSKRQPINVEDRGSWSKREPIKVDERGSWSKRQPIDVEERGSWSKRQPINVDERGSWNKRQPISVEERGSWSKRQPISVEERGSWSKRLPISVEERGSWSKRQPINIKDRGSWS